MTPESDYLIRLAEQITAPYTEIPTLRAAMITGSAAKGLADSYSDIDMTMYYEGELPDEETLAAIRTGLGGSERRWLIGDRDEGGFAEAYGLHQIEVQIGHTLIEPWEQTIVAVQSAEEVDTPSQKALEGTLACKALYGDAYIDRWRTQIADFPPQLARAMVEHNLKFFAVWGLEPHFRTRDATVWYYQILVETAQRLLGVLAGLNRLYYTTFQFKRQARFIDEMTIKPDDFARRLEALFTADLHDALAEVEALAGETIALVESHMPEVDTSAAKARLGWRQEAWLLPT